MVFASLFFIQSVSFTSAVQIYVKESQILLIFSIALPLKIMEKSQNRGLFFKQDIGILVDFFYFGNSFSLTHEVRG